jgi:hypothetical protein
MKIRSSTLLLQRLCLGLITRRQFKRKQQAIIRIQSVVRGWYARDYYSQLKTAANAKLDTEAKRDEITFLKLDDEQKMKNILWQRSMTEIQMSLGAATGIKDIYAKDTLQATDEEIQNQFESVDYNSAPPAREASAIDLLKVHEDAVEGRSKEESEVDNLFAFIGDFDPTLRTAQIEGADTLELMATNLFDEIDGLFEEEEELEEEKEEEEYYSEDDAIIGEEDEDEEDNSHGLGSYSNMGSMDLKRVLRNNPLVNAEEARNRASVTGIDPNQKWTMVDFADKYFYSGLGKKV